MAATASPNINPRKVHETLLVHLLFDHVCDADGHLVFIDGGGCMMITIPGEPIAKDRHRCGCTHERRPFSYDPQMKAEMPAVREIISRAFREAFESENKEIVLKASEIASATSFNVSLVFLFTPPRSLSTAARNGLLWGFELYNQKPDLDNLEKFYLDCATRVIWNDDAQIVSLSSRKGYAEDARTEMTVSPQQGYMMKDSHMKVLKLFSPSEMNELFVDMRYFSRADFDESMTYSLAAFIAFSNKYADRIMKVKKITAKEQ